MSDKIRQRDENYHIKIDNCLDMGFDSLTRKHLTFIFTSRLIAFDEQFILKIGQQLSLMNRVSIIELTTLTPILELLLSRGVCPSCRLCSILLNREMSARHSGSDISLILDRDCSQSPLLIRNIRSQAKCSCLE